MHKQLWNFTNRLIYLITKESDTFMHFVHFVKSITSFLEEYVIFPKATYARPGELEEQYIWAAILLLLTENAFTKEELKAKVLKEKHIIIPDYYFDRDLYADKYGK